MWSSCLLSSTAAKLMMGEVPPLKGAPAALLQHGHPEPVLSTIPCLDHTLFGDPRSPVAPGLWPRNKSKMPRGTANQDRRTCMERDFVQQCTQTAALPLRRMRAAVMLPVTPSPFPH